MADRYILSFDPGKSSGIALGVVGDDNPYRLVEAWQVEGGVVGLAAWVRDNFVPHSETDHAHWDFWELKPGLPNPRVCSEKFTPLQNKGFAQTLDSTEPLRCEGALIALGVMPDYPDDRWRRPNAMYLYGGSNLAGKKKRGKDFLKSRGMYLTGRDVGRKDANDAISAIWHGVSYAAHILKHEPTFRAISDWTAEYDGLVNLGNDEGTHS